ncbi:hypothetical protein [Rhodococcus rhodochrous]|uniref:hypothetical protein n=1 Tax=Rhodococcus rhodochrous TaxID=1829 RepID=UPI00177D1E83|nr:hypothetical protein [Rhodococcus rhodochrous]QOH59930.1 hypothetical protein C6Y44_27990 [Rhodococcus rhodochrous]
MEVLRDSVVLAGASAASAVGAFAVLPPTVASVAAATSVALAGSCVGMRQNARRRARAERSAEHALLAARAETEHHWWLRDGDAPRRHEFITSLIDALYAAKDPDPRLVDRVMEELALDEPSIWEMKKLRRELLAELEPEVSEEPTEPVSEPVQEVPETVTEVETWGRLEPVRTVPVAPPMRVPGLAAWAAKIERLRAEAIRATGFEGDPWAVVMELSRYAKDEGRRPVVPWEVVVNLPVAPESWGDRSVCWWLPGNVIAGRPPGSGLVMRAVGGRASREGVWAGETLWALTEIVRSASEDGSVPSAHEQLAELRGELIRRPPRGAVPL